MIITLCSGQEEHIYTLVIQQSGMELPVHTDWLLFAFFFCSFNAGLYTNLHISSVSGVSLLFFIILDIPVLELGRDGNYAIGDLYFATNQRNELQDCLKLTVSYLTDILYVNFI